MDSVPEPAVCNSPNINSVLKPPKPRVPLKDLMSAAPEEDNTAVRKRRVSFANVNKIKEFSAGAESMVVCQTPAYEEPFSISSDSSLPSGNEGWTPAKGQSSDQSAYNPDKENLSIPPFRIPAVMDSTNVVGNFSTRYSVNGMDLTDICSSYKSGKFEEQTRLSLGMDLTNVVSGHLSQNTRYSMSGMDLTDIAQSHDALLEKENRLSSSMDFTGVISHPLHGTRYSVHGMDLTGVDNLPQTFHDRRSARYSVGMDMTNVVSNPMNTIRYSSNEMDLTEVAKAFQCNEQRCEEEASINSLINDSDALELTEAVNGIQFSAVSPKNKFNDIVTENVIYSVNNTRHALGNLDFQSAVGSSLSMSQRKSCRQSLVNMDLTKIVGNSCDDSKFSHIIGDPKIDLGSKNNPVCDMSFAENMDEGKTRVSIGCMDLTSIVDKSEFRSFNSDSISNEINCTYNNINSIKCDKENILSEYGGNFAGTKSDICKDQKHFDPEFKNISFSSTASDSLLIHTTKQLVDMEKEQSVIKEQIKSNISGNNQPKANCLETNEPISESPLIQLYPKTSLKQEKLEEGKLTFVKINDNKNESSLFLDDSNCTTNEPTNKNHFSFNAECKQNVNESKRTMDECDISCTEKDVIGLQNKSGLECTQYSTLDKMEAPVIDERMSINDSMHVSLSDTVEELKSEIHSKQSFSSELGKSDPNKTVSQDCCLEKVVMNMSLANSSSCHNEELNHNEETKKQNDSFETLVSDPFLKTVEQEDNLRIILETDKLLSQELKTSPNSSLNLSNSSVICNKNITMTRGRGKSIILTPNTCLDISNSDQTIKDGTMSCRDSIDLKTNISSDVLKLSESNLQHEVHQSETISQNRGKRSFEAALESENDTEESPVKQLCLSRDDHSNEFDVLNNVTVPSFLMETVSASNETDASLVQVETSPALEDNGKLTEETPTAINEKTVSCSFSLQNPYKRKEEFSLRMDDSFTNIHSETSIRNEVIDLCESSFDATTTEVRDLINNSRYKSTNNVTNHEEIINKPNVNFDCSTNSIKKFGLYKSDDDHSDHTNCLKTEMVEEEHYTSPLKFDDNLKTDPFKKEGNELMPEPINLPNKMQLNARQREWRRIRTIDKHTYAATLVPNWIEILFTIDSCGNLAIINHKNINSGNTAIGEYLLRQAKNHVFPAKESDLIQHLESAKKSYLARLARNINIICKYHNGKIKGDMLTLEIANCQNHIWVFVNVNIKHPRSLNQTDITISEQKIGKLKLSLIRKVFITVEPNEDQLLNFAKALSRMQHSDFQFEF